MACTLQCWMAVGPKCRCVCDGQYHGIFKPDIIQVEARNAAQSHVSISVMSKSEVTDALQ